MSPRLSDGMLDGCGLLCLLYTLRHKNEEMIEILHEQQLTKFRWGYRIYRVYLYLVADQLAIVKEMSKV